MAVRQPSKLVTWVRFPSPAPTGSGALALREVTPGVARARGPLTGFIDVLEFLAEPAQTVARFRTVGVSGEQEVNVLDQLLGFGLSHASDDTPPYRFSL
jgi:hypothetical protein